MEDSDVETTVQGSVGDPVEGHVETTVPSPVGAPVVDSVLRLQYRVL